MIRPVGVIGCGYWGRNLVRNFHHLGALAAVSDPDGGRASEMSLEFGVPALGLDELLGDTQIPAIVIAAPAALHFDLTSRALGAGKDVFVEKPLALEMDQARLIVEAAQRADLILMVGHLMQYHTAFVTLKEMVDAGRLGNLQYVYSNRLNLGRFRQEEDILWSFAPHDISMILSLIGTEPHEVRAVGSYHLSDRIADVTTTHLAFPEGQRAHVYVSWLHPYKEQKLVLVADEGMAVFDDGEDWSKKLQVYPHKVLWESGVPQPHKGDAEFIGLEPIEPLRSECQHFLDCVLTREVPKTDGREGLRVLSVLARAAESMRAGTGEQDRASR